MTTFPARPAWLVALASAACAAPPPPPETPAPPPDHRPVAVPAAAPAPPSRALPKVADLDLQPVAAGARRVVEALDYLGAPLPPADREALLKALDDPDAAKGVATVQEILDRHCIAGVHINPESRVKVQPGPAAAELDQNGWRVFPVKVHNEGRVTAPLAGESPQAALVYRRSKGKAEPEGEIKASEIRDRWLDLAMFDGRPLNPELSGYPLEYRIIQLYSRDAGAREARISFNVGQGTQDIGFRNEADILFQARPAVPVTLRVQDERGEPAVASFVIRDRQGRVYPSQAKRLAPDFFFHAQVYRYDGETVLLPPGAYDFEVGRGPEYRVLRRAVTVPPGAAAHEEAFRLERWTDPAASGWISGDHHIHAAGCKHYEKPTEGVSPEDMMRQILGEDVKVGCVLTWGPCYYFQKQFFTGGVDKLSTDRYLMRYDIEVSGFPSSHAGHLVLLRLREQDYPGTKRIDDWPSWDLPVFRWAKAQGAVTGFAHSGSGLKVDTDELPNFVVPPFDGIGANEYIMDVTHEVPGPDGAPVPAVDFISLVDTPPVWELNIWYHTLNAGFRTRASGETDFPCITGERVGVGRVYVKTPPGKLDYDAWADGLRDGRSYVGDGRSHLLDFRVDDTAVGGERKLDGPATVVARARVAALLPEAPPEAGFTEDFRKRRIVWHLELARVAATREVPVELIVNGRPVARRNVVADGVEREVALEAKLERSAWVALRIHPSCHTNPVWVTVGGRPVREKESIEWCLKGVDQCWSRKEAAIREGAEREEARKAYDHARTVYRRRLEECP